MTPESTCRLVLDCLTCHCHRPVQDNLFAQRRGTNLEGPAMGREDETVDGRSNRRKEQLFLDQRNAPTKNNNVRSQQGDHLGERPAVGFAGLLEHVSSEFVAGGCRFGYVLGRQQMGLPLAPSEQIQCVASAVPLCRATPGRRGDGPTAGHGFEGLVGRVAVKARTEMAQFGRHATAATKQVAIDDQSAANTATHIAVEDDASSLTRPIAGLGQPRRIGIVDKRGGQAERVAAPVNQRKAIPALDLVARDRRSRLGIDRTAETDSDSPDFVSLKQFRAALGDLAQDAFRAAGWCDVRTAQVDQRLPLSWPHSDLEFRSANFNS